MTDRIARFSCRAPRPRLGAAAQNRNPAGISGGAAAGSPNPAPVENAKLSGARDRIRRERGNCEGLKSLAERSPEVVALAKRQRRASPNTGKRLSLREIAAELEKAGYLNERGRRFHPDTVGNMLR
jgi:hypothetical protein